MKTRELSAQKAEAKIEEFEARLEVARAKLKGASADARLSLQQEIDAIEKGLGTARVRLKALAENADDGWHELSHELESLATSVGKKIDGILSKKD